MARINEKRRCQLFDWKLVISDSINRWIHNCDRWKQKCLPKWAFVPMILIKNSIAKYSIHLRPFVGLFDLLLRSWIDEEFSFYCTSNLVNWLHWWMKVIFLHYESWNCCFVVYVSPYQFLKCVSTPE